MGTSDITCSGLVAIDDVAGIKLEWIVTDPWPKDMRTSLDVVEAWAATVNDRAHGSFAKVGEGRTDFSHAGLTRGETRFYSIRARNKHGSYGPWYPVSPTAGVQGTELSGDVLLADPGYWKHPSGLIHQWGGAIATGGSVTISYPIPFPNGVFNIQATINGASIADRTVSITPIGADLAISVRDSAGVGQTENVLWQALGY